MIKKYIFILLGFLYYSLLFSANKTFSGSGNFSDAVRWGGSLPLAGDNLIINGNCTFDNAANNLAYGTLSIGGGSAGILSWPALGTNTLSITDFLTAKNNSTVNMTNGGFLKIRGSWGAKNINFIAGTGTVIWNVTAASSSLPNTVSTYYNLITETNTGVVSFGVAGAGTVINNNLTINTGTLNAGNVNYTCYNTIYVTSVLEDNSNAGNNTITHLVINSGGRLYSTIGVTYTINGNLTMLGGAISGAGTPILNVAGNFLVLSGNNDVGNSELSVIGTTSVSATLNVSTNGGTKTLRDFIVTSTGSFNCSVAVNWVIEGNITVNGSLNANAGTYSLTGIGKTINGTAAMTFSNVTCTGAYTNNANVSLSNSLLGLGGTWTQGATGILNLAIQTTSLTVTNFNTSAIGNMVNYSLAGNQTIRNPTDISYHHLSSSTSATKSFTSNIIVNGNMAISSSSLDVSVSNFSLSVGGNWTNTAGTFVGRAGTVTFLGTTAQTIFKSGGEIFNDITFLNSGSKTLLSAITASNVLINTGSNLDVNTTNNQITVKGNFTNSGTFVAQQGLVFLNGTVAQSIGGTSITNFYNLSLNNNAGANITNAENLISTLTLSNGTFNTNSQVFTMISTAANTARIAEITGTGDIIGNVTAQRFAPGGTTGWALIGTPMSSALTFQAWNDDFAITCASCPNGSLGGFTSIYSYNEAAAGSYSVSTAYLPITSITNPITPNKAYWVYLGNGQTSTTPITIDVTGTVRKFNNPIPLTKTNTGSVPDDGWNLIHNPYPSPIKWSLLRAANPNVDNAIYSYNADLNGGTGSSVAYVNGISSPAIGSGGIGDDIPMCQGFQVHCTANTTLNALESNKVAGNPTFMKINQNAQVASVQPLLRFYLDGPTSFHDETVLYIQPGATNNFDAEFDAIKMAGQDPNAPAIMLQNGTEEFQVNGINTITSTFSMPLKTTTGHTGTYTISLANFNSFPTGACISLYDTFNGITTDLKTSNYIFTLNSSTTNARFVVNITINPLNITTEISQPVCSSPNAGQISVVGNNSGPWNYFWKDASGTIIKTSLNKTSADTLSNLTGGNYTIDINTVGQCDNNDSAFTINTIEVVTAQFTSVDTVYLTGASTITFNNSSLNAINNNWDFGDSFGFSSSVNPDYNYYSAGVYTVSLITTSNSGCLDTAYKSIVVISDITTGLLSQNNSGAMLIKTLDDNEFVLQGNIHDSSLLNIKLFDGLGKLVIDFGNFNSGDINLSINLESYKAGVYLLNVIGADTYKTIKLPVK